MSNYKIDFYQHQILTEYLHLSTTIPCKYVYSFTLTNIIGEKTCSSKHKTVIILPTSEYVTDQVNMIHV